MSLSLIKSQTQSAREAQPDDAVASAANDVMLAIRALREAHMRLHDAAQSTRVKAFALREASSLYSTETSLVYNLKDEGLVLNA